MSEQGDLQRLRMVLGEVLDLGDRAESLDTDSPLLGALPEFDSLAVISLIEALQERFSLQFSDEDIDPDIFETVGNLLEFIRSRRAG